MFNCFSKLVVTLFKQFGLQCKKKCIKFSDLIKISLTVAEKANLSKMTCSKNLLRSVLLYKLLIKSHV